MSGGESESFGEKLTMSLKKTRFLHVCIDDLVFAVHTSVVPQRAMILGLKNFGTCLLDSLTREMVLHYPRICTTSLPTAGFRTAGTPYYSGSYSFERS